MAGWGMSISVTAIFAMGISRLFWHQCTTDTCSGIIHPVWCFEPFCCRQRSLCRENRPLALSILYLSTMPDLESEHDALRLNLEVTMHLFRSPMLLMELVGFCGSDTAFAWAPEITLHVYRSSLLYLNPWVPQTLLYSASCEAMSTIVISVISGSKP